MCVHVVSENFTHLRKCLPNPHWLFLLPCSLSFSNMPEGKKRKITAGPTARKFYKQAKKSTTNTAASKRRSAPSTYVRKRARTKVWKSTAISHNAILHKKKILPVPGLTGDFVNLPSICRLTVEVSSDPIYLYVVHTASDATALLIAESNGITAVHKLQQVTQAQPNSMRAQRMSVSLRQTTIAQNIGSVVRVLNTPQHFNIQFSQTNTVFLSGTCKNEMIALMNSDSQVRSYAGHEFTHEKVITAAPATIADFINYWNYSPWNDTDREISNTIFTTANSRSVSNMILIKFEPSLTPQTFDIAIHRQDACRFSHGSVLSSLATQPVYANTAAWQASVQVAQQVAASSPVQAMGGMHSLG